jgi:FkbM family methyltransferase
MSETRLHVFTINGVRVQAADRRASVAAGIVACELQSDCYGLGRIDFKPGDVILDIGAHIGLFAVYAGLRFPEVLIHAFEPFPDNCELLRENLKRNRVGNVRVHNLGVSGDGRLLEMATNPENSGGASCHSFTLTHRRTGMIPSTTLDGVFDSLGIDACKLLKIDCEGSEYEILFSTSALPKVEYLSGEFHFNDHLLGMGYTAEGLLQHCRKYIEPGKLKVSSCRMRQ